MRNLVAHWVASVLALFVVSKLNLGIEVKNNVALVLVVVAMAFANTFIRPVVMFFAWPVNCITFGLFGFVLNIALFFCVGSGLIPGYTVHGPAAAVIGSLCMGVLSGVFNFILQQSKR